MQTCGKEVHKRIGKKWAKDYQGSWQERIKGSSNELRMKNTKNHEGTTEKGMKEK